MKERRISPERRAVDRLKKTLAIEHAKLEILQGISRVSQETYNIIELYDYYLNLILNITGTRAGSILLLDEVSKDLMFVAAKGKGASGLLGKKIPSGEGIAGWVARTGRSYFSGDAAQDRLIKKEFGRAIGVTTENILCVPLKVGRRVLGVLEILNRKDRKPFHRDDLELLSAVSVQMATVIDNTRLFHKYDEKVKKLQIMKEISRVLNSTLDEREVRRRAMEAATRLMNAEVGSLLLIDEKTNELFFEVALGERGERIKEIRLKMGEGIAGWVASTGQPLIVDDVQKDPRFSKKADDKSAFTTRNMICVPVKIKDKIIGVLQAINKRGGQPFTQWDLEEFQSLSAQVAIAIENANLYKELREAFLGTAQALGDAIEAKDAYTAGHTQRVLSYSLLMGKHLSLPSNELENLKLAAALHDIGKIGVDDQILRKPGKLDEEEKKKMDDHTLIGPRIVQNIKQMNAVIPGIRHHHEEFDGTGYPHKLSGEQIPLTARIIAVADCFDAMTTDRPYRKALSIQTALDELHKMSGTQFDGKVVEAFVKAYEAGELNDTLVGRPTSPT
jgi:HD-GYP domain-containing protein (c-di-GMP phosphodiesterase class II)